MNKKERFTFRTDSQTLKLLRALEKKTGNAKSVIIRNLIRQAAESTSLHKAWKTLSEEQQ